MMRLIKSFVGTALFLIKIYKIYMHYLFNIAINQGNNFRLNLDLSERESSRANMNYHNMRNIKVKEAIVDSTQK